MREPCDNQWIVEGPHLMIIVPDPALLEAFPAEPTSGEPYIMWKGTPYGPHHGPDRPEAGAALGGPKVSAGSSPAPCVRVWWCFLGLRFWPQPL
jgi:hypothetical protein